MTSRWHLPKNEKVICIRSLPLFSSTSSKHTKLHVCEWVCECISLYLVNAVFSSSVVVSFSVSCCRCHFTITSDTDEHLFSSLSLHLYNWLTFNVKLWFRFQSEPFCVSPLLSLCPPRGRWERKKNKVNLYRASNYALLILFLCLVSRFLSRSKVSQSKYFKLFQIKWTSDEGPARERDRRSSTQVVREQLKDKRYLRYEVSVPSTRN